MEHIELSIKKFLSRFFKKYEIQNDEDIFSLGFVNSLFAMQLVLFIEQNFDISVETQDMDLDNFRTVNKMIAFVEKKLENKEVTN
ncbi:acyl carrier protein [Bacillus wiedmannii]|uniref:acyl carrier protein n=1 Tax=Bacillus wiedmannii TaxID=1890302 RepID=UPI000B44DFC2|nr:D-alanyl carrier protein [Bacillus thuringiensis serovar argentinensis]